MAAVPEMTGIVGLFDINRWKQYLLVGKNLLLTPVTFWARLRGFWSKSSNF